MREIELLSDCTFWLDGGAMFGVVPKTLWSRFVTPDAENRVRVGANCLLLKLADGYALIEAGLGDIFPQEKRYQVKTDPGPRLPDRLAALNVDPGEIRWVILTHLHYDHAGWISCADPKAPGGFIPTFPNARYVVQKGELAEAANPLRRMAASYLDRQWKPISEAGLWKLVEGDAEILDGVRVERTAAHNANHQIVLIERAGRRILCLSDIVPTWLNLRPAWCTAYDRAPDEVARLKEHWTDRAIAEQWTLLLYHEPAHPLGRLRRDENGAVDVDYLDGIF